MKTNRSDLSDILLSGLLFLFFFQLLTDFIAAIYAFGLLRTSLTAEIAAVVLLFSPLVLLFFKKRLSPRFFFWLGLLVLLSRVVEVLLETRGQMLATGVGAAAFLIYFPAQLRDSGQPAPASRWGAGLFLATALSVLFHALGSGVDGTTYGSWRVLGWSLVLLAGFLLYRRYWIAGGAPVQDVAQIAASTARRQGILGLTLAIMAAFILLYFAFTSPNVLARWVDASYSLVIWLGLFSLLVTFVLLSFENARKSLLARPVLFAWNLLFIACLELVLVGAQVRFPGSVEAYPLPQPPQPPLQTVFFVGVLLFWPVILVDFSLFCREVIRRDPSYRSLGASFGLSALFLLVMVFGHVFTTVYDYIPVVGPFFRDKFWFVYLVPAIFLLLPIFRRIDPGHNGAPFQPGTVRLLSTLIAVIWIISGTGTLLHAPRPVQPAAADRPLRILTYNLQQGYSADGQRNLDGQLALVRRVNADLVGLQETDTNRISGSHDDLIRYFADRLNLYSFYGPSPVTGTFGIALLSKYPLIDPKTYFLYSTGEQTAIISAQVEVDGKKYHIFVTHLGNGGPVFQQQGVLQLVSGLEKVILVGDFNFRPDSESYRMTTAVMVDSWLQKWPGGDSGQGVDPADRIDHIFLSPDLTVAESRFLAEPASDHPALYTDIER